MHIKRLLARALIAAALAIGLVSLTSLPASAATTRVVGAAATLIAFTLPGPSSSASSSPPSSRCWSAS
jgi:hypothetical protein